MDLGLSGKTIAVMAASQGLGRAAASVLAREGANLVLCARRADVLDRTVGEIRAAHPKSKIEGVVADVSQSGDVARFIDAAAKAGGGVLDGLVCNSGGPPPRDFAGLTDADWSSAFELLVLSHVRALRHAVPHMKKRGGAVVHITSTSVKQPIPSLILSNSLRLSVVGMAKTLSGQLGVHGIRINCVSPGSYETDRIHEVVEADAKAKGVPVEAARHEREKEIPLGRMGKPEELGEVIAFLLSPRASYLTGATISVDGGLVRWTFG